MRNPFKKKAPRPEFNIKHPDIAHVIEEAFKVGGKTYYRFNKELLIPAGRYKYIYAYIKEADMRMNVDTLKRYVQDFKNILNGGNKKTVEIGELWKLIINLESRLALGMDPETIARLASVVFFDDTEDLSTYDKKHGQEKIDLWNKHKFIGFFLTTPMGELLGLKNISTESLQASIQEHLEMIQNLTFDHQKLSLANLSENGKKPS